MQTLLRTPLYERHVALGARMVPFAGWEMPVQYEGVIPEHRAVREDCGVFDVSHMGRFEFEGPKVPAALQALLSNDIDQVAEGGAQYTLLTNDRGGIIDDLIVYELERFHYLLIVNASNRESDYTWLKERKVRRLFLAGFLIDFSIRATAQDARKSGLDVVIIEDAVRGLNVRGSLEHAWLTLAEIGARRVMSESLVLS
jgi:hypothetical protein